jgi:hypothetical protein
MEDFFIEVVGDHFSKKEIQKIVKLLKEIENKEPTRQIIWKSYRTGPNEKLIVNVYGNFSNEEIKNFLQCLRDIEQNKPTRHLNILLNTPDKTTEEMVKINDSITPDFPIKRVIKFEEIK